MNSHYNSNDDIEQTKSKLREGFDSIKLPESLAAENMLKKIEDIPQDNVVKPMFSRNMIAAAACIAVVVTTISLVTWRQNSLTKLDAGEPMARGFAQPSTAADEFSEELFAKAEDSMESTQDAVTEGSGISQESSMSNKEESKELLQSKMPEKAAKESSQDSTQPPQMAAAPSADASNKFPDSSALKKPILPETDTFYLLQMFPKEGITTIEITSNFNAATAVYTGSEQIDKMLGLLREITLENITEKVKASAGDTLTISVVYDDGSFYEVVFSDNLIVVNPQPNSGATYINANPKATKVIKDKYNADIGK